MVLVTWLMLLGVLGAWWLTGLGWPPPALSLAPGLLLLPLVAILPPILNGSQRACAAATLLLLPYLGWGLTEAVANPAARHFAAATVFTSLACFAGVVLWLRVLRSA